MDSIYDNLENYNDANVIQELTNENSDLKNKLQEYATTMAKLQNDFDKLAADYKKLEINYSSLLKTARAEIERKSQIITNLNIERDKMVLGTIKNKHILNLNKNVPEPRREKDNSRKIETDTHAKITKELSDDAKSRSSSRGRKEKSRTPSEDSSNRELTCKSKPVSVDKISEKTEMPKGRTSNIKENITRGYKEHEEERNLQSKALCIKSRRKSMPTTRLHCKFSSDDEREDSSSAVEANRKKLTRDNANRKNYDRSYNDKQDNRRFGSNTFHNRTSRRYDRYDNDSDRGRDSNSKYEYSHRHRRKISPERSRRRSPRNYSDDRHLQFENSRKRALESPPRNKYYQHRGNYDRDNNDYEIRGPHLYDQERLTPKQKYLSDYEEPLMKRSRTNSYKLLSEDENRQYEHQAMDHIPCMAEAVQMFEHVSCQSPDYLLAESVIAQPIREIKNTAAYPLEDPRENSKNYIIKTENGIKMLSTIIGRNVDLKPVDTSIWDIKQMELPDPLRKQPLESNVDVVREIYLDFENPVSNLSMESGEILPLEQGTSTSIGDIKTPKDYENITICKESSNKEEVSNKILHTYSYKIPKINKNITNTRTEDKSAYVSKYGHISPENKTTHEKRNKNTSVPNEKISSATSSSEIVTTCQLNKSISSMIVNREMVVGDLELSDETYDSMDIQSRTVKEEIVDVSGTHNVMKNNDNNSRENNVLVNPNADTYKCDGNDINDVSQKQDQPKVKISAANKKHKTKKKSQRQRSIPEQNIENISVPNEEKAKLSKEVKNKFCDLFGDSSSLITPEDLGLPQPQLQAVLPPKYLQIFEDAQDATVLAKTVEENEVPTKGEVRNTEKDIDQSKSKTKSGKSIEHKKKKSKKAIDSKPMALEIENVDITNKEIPNAKSVTTESNIVQTVIISTGVQPQALSTNAQPEKLLESLSTCHSNIDKGIPIARKVDNYQTENYIVQESRDAVLQALATSTPAKLQNCLQPVNCANTPEVGNNSSEVRVNVEQITPVVDQYSDSNTLDSQTDVETPDVRIFIRRRRKGVKKVA